jgi:hypothetical protein
MIDSTVKLTIDVEDADQINWIRIALLTTLMGVRKDV